IHADGAGIHECRECIRLDIDSPVEMIQCAVGLIRKIVCHTQVQLGFRVASETSSPLQLCSGTVIFFLFDEKVRLPFDKVDIEWIATNQIGYVPQLALGVAYVTVDKRAQESSLRKLWGFLDESVHFVQRGVEVVQTVKAYNTVVLRLLVSRVILRNGFKDLVIQSERAFKLLSLHQGIRFSGPDLNLVVLCPCVYTRYGQGNHTN